VNLQSRLKRLGVPSRLVVVDWPMVNKLRRKGGWGIGFTGNTTRFDPSHQHNFSLHGSGAYGGFDHPKLNALLKAGENEIDFDKRYEIYKQVQNSYTTR